MEVHHIHKPKPWHGWREFLKDYAIIVAGVLTALAGGQLVDSLHWRHEVDEMRQALDKELALDARLIERDLGDGVCATQFADALDLWSQGKSSTNPFAEGRRALSLDSYYSSVWDAALGGQVAAHIPTAERLAYANAYGYLADLRQVVGMQRQIWENLAGYAEKSQLADEERRRLGEDVTRARVLNRVWRSRAGQALDLMRAAGVKVQSVGSSTNVASCRTSDPFGVLP